MPTFPEVATQLSGTTIFPKSGPDHVFHYTTIEGLVGILSSGVIWATDLSYTNDASEYIYADQIIEEALGRFKLHDPMLAEFLSILRADPRDGFDVYAACFCERGDLLSQWRAYASGGTGYAIQFDWTALSTMFSGIETAFSGRVEYGGQAQTELIQNVVSGPALNALLETNTPSMIVEQYVVRLAEEARGEPCSAGEGFKNRLEAHRSEIFSAISKSTALAFLEAFVPLTLCRAFLKSPTFSEEQEWRLVSLRSRNTSGAAFRASRGMLIPYVPLNLRDTVGKLPIRRILVGPTLHPAQAKRSLEAFLQNRGLPEIRVEASSVPLRA